MVEAILRCKEKGFRETVTGDHLTVFLCFLQKIPGSAGSGRIIHIKNSDYGGISHRHIIAD